VASFPWNEYGRDVSGMMEQWRKWRTSQKAPGTLLPVADEAAESLDRDCQLKHVFIFSAQRRRDLRPLQILDFLRNPG
jgi:hypothetical protein